LLFLSLGAAEIDRRRIEFDRHYLNVLTQIQPPADWRTALSEADQALEYGAFRPHVFYLRGVALETLGRDAEAMDAYRKTLARSPEAWYVHERLGLIDARQGRIEDALAHCRKALSILDYAQARNTLGVVLSRKGDAEGALREWRRAVQLDSGSVEAHSNLGAALYARGDVDSAIAHYRQAIQLRPDYAEVHSNLGLALHARGDLGEAVAHYRQATRINPDYARAYYNLGLALTDAGDRAGAVEALRACLRTNAGDQVRAKARDALLRLGEAP
jgi:Flp pilus assembly protein TadD